MDGVLSDTYVRMFDLYESETGRKMDPSEAFGKLEEETFKNQRRWVMEPGFFRNLPVMADSQEVMNGLNQKYDVVVASLATEFPLSLNDKIFWLHEHFPFIHWSQIFLCGNKSLIKADIMIDDHPKNLDYFDGRTLMFTQPTNIHLKTSKHQRVDSWKEIKKLLL